MKKITAGEITAVEDALGWVDRVAIDQESVASFQSEEDFMVLAVDLTKEAASYVCIAACIFSEEDGWSRDRAAISGNIVRIYKLMHGFLDQICQQRDELAFIFQRLISEGLINIRYLIINFNKDTVDSYIAYSLQHERNLRSLILANIAARDGEHLPIENRMLKSIEHTVTKSGIALEDLPEKRISHWGGANLRDKANAVGFGDFYLATIGGGSSSIHGNWQEISGNNLEWNEESGKFTPRLDWRRPRPQVPVSLCQCVVDTLRHFFEFALPKDAFGLIEHSLEDLQRRLILLQDSQEKYLHSKIWPEI